MDNIEHLTRRNFIQKAAILSAAGTVIATMAKSADVTMNENEVENYTFLFQGDSITDGNRSRNVDWNHVLGHGYAYLIAARLWYEFPKKGFHFFNRGISGNTVGDLLKRWNEDTIAIKPDLLSILIGINDTMKAVNGDLDFTVAKFEHDYRALLIETRSQLPGLQLVICEPFILPVGHVKEKWAEYDQAVRPRQEIAKKLALEFNAIFVPLQAVFEKAVEENPPADFWLWDGIHPMPNGHELFARTWIKDVSKKLKFIR